MADYVVDEFRRHFTVNEAHVGTVREPVGEFLIRIEA